MQVGVCMQVYLGPALAVCAWLCLGSQHRNSLGCLGRAQQGICSVKDKEALVPWDLFHCFRQKPQCHSLFFYGLHNRITSADFILEATLNSRGNNNLVALGATPVLAAPPVQAAFFTGHLWASVAAWRRLCLTLFSLVRKCLSSASCTYSKENLRKVLPPQGRP